MIIPAFTPQNWFWIVAGDESRAWSSAAGAYVGKYPQETVTRIVSEAELTDVLRSYGLPPTSPTDKDFAVSVQTHVDAVAQARGYADGVALAGYSTSTIPAWAAEAATFIAWRDAVWMHCYRELAKVQSGQRTAPTVEALISELPTIGWP